MAVIGGRNSFAGTLGSQERSEQKGLWERGEGVPGSSLDAVAL